MSFLIKNDELLEKYELCDKVSNTNKKGLYNEKYLRTKIKSYEGKISTNFHDNKGSQYICLSVILIDYYFRLGKNYYPQLFLEECKYMLKKRRCLNTLMTA